LPNVDLRDANLQNANLRAAYLRGADFSPSEGLIKMQPAEGG
jgi:uncharacterized protein YjbI with pentapeptide repeats